MSFLSSDMKLHLQSTDYGKLLSSSEEDLTVSLVDSKLRANLVTEFSCLRSNALPPLSTFLDYITYALTRHVLNDKFRKGHKMSKQPHDSFTP